MHQRPPFSPPPPPPSFPLLSQPADDMRLVKDGHPLTEPDATLADAGVGDGDAVAVVFRDEGARGGWEAVDVEEFDVGGGGE